jgi:di/tricarboxylate transporter
VGWRLLPASRTSGDAQADLFDIADYIAEVRVPEGSAVIGKRVRDLDDLAAKSDIEIVGLTRKGRRLPGLARIATIQADDILVIEASPEGLDEALGALQLEYIGKSEGILEDGDLELAEVVVPESSRLAGRSAMSIRLLYRYRVALVGVSRAGRRFRENVRKLELHPGDVLLLLGPEERVNDVTGQLGLLPLADRGQRVVQRHKVWQAVAIFVAAIAAASAGLVYLPVALGCVVAAYILLNIVPLRDVYTSIEWPVIVLLGSMIPLGGALEASGGSTLIVDAILGLTGSISPAMVLTLLIMVTMTLSDVMNNTATAVIAAPIAVEIANRLDANPDAFLTPIGHKNNTLIMGPGGYEFGDYWRMGLPLEILIVLVSVPMILIVWPL